MFKWLIELKGATDNSYPPIYRYQIGAFLFVCIHWIYLFLIFLIFCVLRVLHEHFNIFMFGHFYLTFIAKNENSPPVRCLSRPEGILRFEKCKSPLQLECKNKYLDVGEFKQASFLSNRYSNFQQRVLFLKDIPPLCGHWNNPNYMATSGHCTFYRDTWARSGCYKGLAAYLL